MRTTILPKLYFILIHDPHHTFFRTVLTAPVAGYQQVRQLSSLFFKDA